MNTDRSRRGVRETYETIGPHFAKTREYAWPEVESFVEDNGDRATDGTALDIGCGNGRHAELLAGVADRVVGVDASHELLSVASERVPEGVALVCGDASRLPIRAGTVGLAVYVATLHHLPSADTRRASLAELARVLAPGGRGLVSVWSTAHDRFDAAADAEAGFDTTVDWTLPGGETVPRFYHIYAPAEFEQELADSPLRTVSVEVSSGNCYAVVESEGKGP